MEENPNLFSVLQVTMLQAFSLVVPTVQQQPRGSYYRLWYPRRCMYWILALPTRW